MMKPPALATPLQPAIVATSAEYLRLEVRRLPTPFPFFFVNERETYPSVPTSCFFKARSPIHENQKYGALSPVFVWYLRLHQRKALRKKLFQLAHSTLQQNCSSYPALSTLPLLAPTFISGHSRSVACSLLQAKERLFFSARSS